MKDKPIPKYQIREKTPEEESDASPSAKLLKKIKEERIKLNREKNEWERVINKINDYKVNIEDLERKRKQKELQVRKLQDQEEKLKNELNKMRTEIKNSKLNLIDKEKELDQKNADALRYQEKLDGIREELEREKKNIEKEKERAKDRIKEIKTKLPG
ncbi:MAG: hypothetical protein ACFE96_19130, partial [Candidatus Hermodarchaeota archaeon]